MKAEARKTVQNARIEKGLTQSELAEKCGCSIKTIQAIENRDDYVVSIPLARKLIEILNVDGLLFLHE